MAELPRTHWLDRLAETSASLDDHVLGLPAPDALRAIAMLGWRRPDVVEALERMAADTALAAGDPESVARGETSRALALLIRARLGVGSTSEERVASLARALPDGICRDAVLASVRCHAERAIAALSDALPHATDARELLSCDALVASRDAPISRSVARERERAITRWAQGPARARSSVTLPWSPSPAVQAMREWAGEYRPPPLAGRLPRVPWSPPRWQPEPAPISDPVEAIRWTHEAISAGVVRSAHPTQLCRPGSPGTPAEIVAARGRGPLPADDALRFGVIYRAWRAAAPHADAALVRALLEWPLETQVAGLDGIADADVASPDVIAALLDFARTGIEAGPVWPRVPHVLEAVVEALVAQAPDEWCRLVVEESQAVDPFARMAAAIRLGFHPIGVSTQAVLDALSLDPFAPVRRLAASARARLRARARSRLRERTSTWCVLRGDDDAERVLESLQRLSLEAEDRAVDRRRAQRLRDRLAIDERQARWLGEPRRRVPGVRDQTVAASATLTATDGRSVDVTLGWDEDAGADPAVSWLREGIGPRTESLSSAVAFVCASPSRFMRLAIEGCEDRAVEAILHASGVELRTIDAAHLRAWSPDGVRAAP
ncbi:MAG: hypothetical protein U0234_24785 [Sandaracinus sp.]